MSETIDVQEERRKSFQFALDVADLKVRDAFDVLTKLNYDYPEFEREIQKKIESYRGRLPLPKVRQLSTGRHIDLSTPLGGPEHAVLMFLLAHTDPDRAYKARDIADMMNREGSRPQRAREWNHLNVQSALSSLVARGLVSMDRFKGHGTTFFYWTNLEQRDKARTALTP